MEIKAMSRKLKLENIYQKKKMVDKKKLIIQCPWLGKPFISHYETEDSMQKYTWKFEAECIFLQAKHIL